MAIDLLGGMLNEAPLPAIPIPLLVLLGAIQNLVLIGVFAGLGLLLGRKLGLGPKLNQCTVGT